MRVRKDWLGNNDVLGADNACDGLAHGRKLPHHEAFIWQNALATQRLESQSPRGRTV